METSQKIFYAAAADFHSIPLSIIGHYGSGPTKEATAKVVESILAKLSKQPTRTFRSSYSQGAVVYHVKQTGRYCYICATGKECKIRVAFNYLSFVTTHLLSF